jgi:hypothetical protein
MKATLVIDRKVVFPEGDLLQMVIWRLPEADIERPYGLSDGTCVVRYDNERGKGDHRHWDKYEESYRFVDIETLMADFLNDVAKARGGKR